MAHENKLQEKEKLIKVIDGTNAPKMTGKSRHKSLKYSHSHGLKDPTSASAVYFGLILSQQVVYIFFISQLIVRPVC